MNSKYRKHSYRDFKLCLQCKNDVGIDIVFRDIDSKLIGIGATAPNPIRQVNT